MSARPISEACGKRLLNEQLSNCGAAKCRFVPVNEDTDWDQLLVTDPWLKSEVRAPSQLALVELFLTDHVCIRAGHFLKFFQQ